MRRLLTLVCLLLALVIPAFADEASCPDVCPRCPSAKTIAEQVTEDIAAKPQPQVIHCRKKARQAGVGGYVSHCLVFFPTAGTPPLVQE